MWVRSINESTVFVPEMGSGYQSKNASAVMGKIMGPIGPIDCNVWHLSLSLRDIEGHVKGHNVRLVKEFLPGSGALGHGSTPEWMVEY